VVFRLSKAIFLGILLGLLTLVGCGDVTWFVFWNTGTIDGASASGAVLIIGTPQDDPLPESVRLIGGEIPPGMKLMQDTTVQGIPEESGNFLMDVEVIETTGRETCSL
jgi:hypothetical protein